MNKMHSDFFQCGQCSVLQNSKKKKKLQTVFITCFLGLPLDVSKDKKFIIAPIRLRTTELVSKTLEFEKVT